MSGGKLFLGLRSCLLDSSKPRTCFIWSFIHSANTSVNTGSQSVMHLSFHLGEAQSTGETQNWTSTLYVTSTGMREVPHPARKWLYKRLTCEQSWGVRTHTSGGPPGSWHSIPRSSLIKPKLKTAERQDTVEAREELRGPAEDELFSL